MSDQIAPRERNSGQQSNGTGRTLSYLVPILAAVISVLLTAMVGAAATWWKDSTARDTRLNVLESQFHDYRHEVERRLSEFGGRLSDMDRKLDRLLEGQRK